MPLGLGSKTTLAGKQVAIHGNSWVEYFTWGSRRQLSQENLKTHATEICKSDEF